MSDVRIRKARPAHDAESALRIKREASTILLTRLGHSLEQIGAWQAKFVTPEYVRGRMRTPHAMFILEVDDVPMGIAGLTLRDDGDDAYVHFGNLYCLESDEGYGSRLMEYRLGVVENFNVDYVQCHVQASNEKARRFVEHYGFEEYGTRRDDILSATQVVYRRRGE